MAKTIEDATVAELDALALERNVADYPTGGVKAEKYEAVKAALGEGYEFEPDQQEPQVTIALVDDVNGAQFGVGDEQVELTAGETVDVPERHGRRLVAEHWFLVSDEVEEPEIEPPEGAIPGDEEEEG
jgi:hypothetical protein